MQAYGLTVDHVYQQARALLQSPADLGNHLLVAMNDDQDSLELVRRVAQYLPDPAEMEVTLIHYLAPMVWATGIGAIDGEMLAYDWDQIAKLEKMEADLTEEMFAQARDILQEAGVATVHIHAKTTPVPFPSVTREVLDALEEGLYSAVVVGRHHHHALSRLLSRDPGTVITKRARGVTVWVVEQ